MMRARAVAMLACALLAGCSLHRVEVGPGGDFDAGDRDAGADGGDVDAGELDAGELDAGELDAGELDAGELDAGDAGGGDDRDGGDLDAGEPDAGEPDAGEPDAGEPDAGTDAGPTCTAGERSCAGADLLECDATGALVVVETCALGCLDTVAPPRCAHIRATHVDDPDRLFDGAADLVVAAGTTVEIDTTTGRIQNTTSGTEIRAAGAIGNASGLVIANVAQASGMPELAVLSVGALRVEAGGTLVANGGRALVVLAEDAITIEGTIDIGGRGRAGGPGAGTGGTMRSDGIGPGAGGRGHVEGTFGGLHSGGGGGGHAAAGGEGGDEVGFDRAEGGTAGPAIADPDATPLVGGGAGGAGADADSGGNGGGGGGALQLTSDVSITIAAGAVVRAPGAGGARGSEGGGGGGAGGAIFLEAPVVSVAGGVFANGGGGGGGDGSAFDGADSGQRGLDAVTGASGGGGATGGGDGGSGGAGTSLAGAGGGNGNGGGGGGGAAGRIRILTTTGSTTGGGAFSPTAPAAFSASTITLY